MNVGNKIAYIRQGFKYLRLVAVSKIKSNIWWLSFIATFTTGFAVILMYCYLRDGYTFNNLTLPDWLNYFAACGTVGGFIYLIIDKIISEKEIHHLKWQSEIPFITLSSPCDPTLNYCDINILGNTSIFEGRGYEYFSVCNLGKLNAYDISLLFSTDEQFSHSKIFNRHYINHLVPLKVLIGADSSYDETSKKMLSEQMTFYEFKESIYSNYNVDPVTKLISNSKFDLCNCIDNCNLSPSSPSEKYFFVRIIYYSSFAKKHRYKIVTDFKVHVVCTNSSTNNQAKEKVNEIRIKGITLTNYNYEFVNE